MTKLLAALLLTSSALLAQVVEGSVVNSATGAPIAGASVSIEIQGKAAYHATSNDQGVFRIEDVADGTYTASAGKPGFRRPQDALPSPFRVAAGLNPISLQIPLVPMAKVSGRVLDANDKPVPHADVLLLQGTMAGEGHTTDAEGGFSFGEMQPGSYFLSAQPPSGFAPPPPRGDEHYGWVKTWFPGVTDISAAQKIELRPGADLVGQDLKLRAVPVHNVRGMIRDTKGDPAGSLPITISSGGVQPVEQHTASAKDGSFQFADLSDGYWNLSAEVKSGDTTLRALASVKMAGRDTDDVELRLAAPFSVPLHFLVDSSDSATLPGGVMLTPEAGGNAVAVGSRDKEGNYKIEGIYSGRYTIMAIPPGGPFYLDSIQLGDRDVMGQMVEFSPGSPALKIAYKSDGGTIRGTVENCGKATVEVAPEDPALERGELYSLVRSAGCSEDGHFEIRNLRPGRYYTFAFDHLDQLVYGFIADLPTLINKAVTVDVEAKQTANVELKVTPR
jgi:hypothetical protein